MLSYMYVSVPCRNRILFRCVFRSHHCIQSAVSLSFPLRAGLKTCCVNAATIDAIIYASSLSPALNGSLDIQHFKRSNAIEIRDGITFDFYTGLPHIYYCTSKFKVKYGWILQEWADVFSRAKGDCNCCPQV